MQSAEQQDHRDGSQVRIVLMTVFLAYMGQMILNPIIAPLSREMGLEEWHIGATISLAAITLACLSQFWGRRSQIVGPKRIFVVSMCIGSFALVSFAVLSWLGIRGVWAGNGVVIGVVLTRGLLYGAGISAIFPTTQTYFVTHAKSENQRVKLLGAAGAAQGLATIIGGVLGGALAAAGGLLLPLSVMPSLMIIGVLVVAFFFKPEGVTSRVEHPKKIAYRDPRVFPYLIAGFILFLAFSSVQTLLGFAIQDRFGLDSSATAGITSAVMVVLSVSMVAMQGGIVPRLHWNSQRLLRNGLLLTTIGMACFLPSSSYILLFAGSAVSGFGIGMAIPGYNTGPTMELSRDEQGSVAGLINANNGVTYAIAPILSTSVYGWNSAVPFFAIVVLIACATAFSFLHPLLRNKERAAEPAQGDPCES